MNTNREIGIIDRMDRMGLVIVCRCLSSSYLLVVIDLANHYSLMADFKFLLFLFCLRELDVLLFLLERFPYIWTDGFAIDTFVDISIFSFDDFLPFLRTKF